MTGSFSSALILIVIAALVLAIVIALIIRANRKTNVIDQQGRARDVLDEGAEPARRNQALIDAPAAVAKTFGETSAIANAPSVAAAGADADAEAGAAVPPTQAPIPAQPPAPAPVPVPAPAPAPATADDLSRIKGVGPKLVTLLAQEGVTSLAQIAAWSEADIAAMDERLGRFKGRITRDQWVEQAKLLISGDEAAYTQKFGNT